MLVAVVGCAMAISAQGRKGLRINEVMVQNDSSIVDDFGRHTAWIELYNSTFAPLDISSVYITNNKAVLYVSERNDSLRKSMMYAVPLGDVNTKMPKRQHILFWTDGQPTKGTFHTNFVLTPGQDNWIGVFDSDGIALIDSVTVPASLLPNTSFARVKDGDKAMGWQVRNDSEGLPVTPSSNNIIKDSNDKVEVFRKQDENGFAMTVMAMAIVFSALLILCISFLIISKISSYLSRERKAKTTKGANLKELAKEDRPDHDSGEEIAAIVMALHEHLDAHDQENTILTINKVKRAYSPWSSKIYNLRELPRK